MKILQFSGGKDSLACLYLLEPMWDELLVMWCDSGAAYPETIKLMNDIEKMVPHFMRINGRQPEFIEKNGHPSDLLPVRNTFLGQIVHQKSGRKFSDYLSCCNYSLWQPTEDACRKVGATVIYRGQRDSDSKKSPVRSGDILDGVQYIFPIQEWSEKKVKDYLGDRIPSYYSSERSSHDCWNCTAYLEDNLERIKNLPDEKQKHVVEILIDMRDAVKRDLIDLDGVINGVLY